MFNLEEANANYNIPLASTRQLDKLDWPFSNHGMYNVKCSYKVAFETSEV